jgi:Spy/CpxP family protein refolding chaperone
MKPGRMLIASMIVLSLLLTASMALAGGPGGESMGPGHPYGSRGLGYYIPDLSQEQIAQMTKLRSQFYNDTAGLRGEMVTKRIELRALLANPEATPEQIAAKEKEILQLRTQFAEKRIALQAKMRGLLTKEQLDRMAAWAPGAGFGFGWRHHHDYSPGMRGYYGPGRGMGQGNDDPGPGSNCPRW